MSTFLEDRAQVDSAAAHARAEEIKNLIIKMTEDIEEVNDIVTKNFQEISFEWADEFQRQWKAVYDKGVPAVMTDMKESVRNVERTVETMEQFSRQG